MVNRVGINPSLGIVIMSCYIRYMKNFLSDLDIKPETKEERKDIDLVIRKVTGKKSTDKCNEVWKEVKSLA